VFGSTGTSLLWLLEVLFQVLNVPILVMLGQVGPIVLLLLQRGLLLLFLFELVIQEGRCLLGGREQLAGGLLDVLALFARCATQFLQVFAGGFESYELLL